MPPTSIISLKNKRLYLYLCTAICVAEFIYPVHSNLHKIILILSLSGYLILLWQLLYPKIIKIIIVLGLLFTCWFIHNQLRATTHTVYTSYLNELQSFEGCRYFWGGENSWGIDCSGLPRKALFWASLKNGRITEALDLWLYDSSAKAISEAYRDRSYRITTLKSAYQQSDLLLPGDMAVTTDGIHLMVFLGNNKWIQADPLAGKVHTAQSDKDQNNWFSSSITIIRWSAFKSVTHCILE